MQLQHLRLARLSQAIPTLFSLMATRQKAHIDRLAERMARAATSATTQRLHRLHMLEQAFMPLVGRKMMEHRHRLLLLQQRIDAANPERLLAKGYSITLRQGHPVRSASELKPGDTVETRLQQGRFSAVVTSLSSNEEEQQPPGVQ
jgi:exodeoxyribonuclease VII large subunit